MTHDSLPTSLSSWKSFLETAPPNTARQFPNLAYRGGDGWYVDIPTLELHCDRDGGIRRFRYDGYPAKTRVNEGGNYRFFMCKCRDCESSERTFAVLIERNSADVEAIKLGEYPPFSSPISARIQKLLSTSDLDLYRRGCRAEAHGLGIGAATYFRRIVEEQWHRFVKEIRNAAERLGAADLGVYDAALREKQFSKAVAMLSDVIPEKLLILNGENPLTLLHRPLSKQLHGLSDDDCLQQAADIRLVLTALLENIGEVLQDQKELRSAAERLKGRGAVPST